MRTMRTVTIVLGASCLLAMAVITVCDVTMRYLFNDPIFGASEMTQYLLGGAVFSGLFAVTRDRAHVKVAIFEPWLIKHMPKIYRGIYDIFSLIGVTSIFAILAWRFLDIFEYPEDSIVLGLPIGLIVGAFTLLSALSIPAALLAIRSGVPEPLPTDKNAE
ncbi:2,3-diketo-L-gulonate TRAP transporter small permease protein YiaM [Pelagimonas phthalicica]|uniref:TRAP transporter small permease protein n=1 Tax=Pelagimonas phthalicica TaxID=1037362 RepID=A0A238JFK6_9RHOB|nr:TRAP transporter small permease [Pelagimonas phthalicica]TDS92141.1 TRAP-type C4-dicarboxylate transport system permease small subunit [Pelagimonas phthalicica]SMX29195.1 2,3-diketo-L-gulonate TRAP transporter small permease protein YiaM [Pelagimonas phthalicica]